MEMLTILYKITSVTSLKWFSVAFSIYFLGVLGIFQYNQNFLTLLLKIEMMYIGISMFLFGYGLYQVNPNGLALGLLVLAFAAAETVFGLSIFFYYYLVKQGKALDPIFRFNRKPKYNIRV